MSMANCSSSAEVDFLTARGFGRLDSFLGDNERLGVRGQVTPGTFGSDGGVWERGEFWSESKKLRSYTMRVPPGVVLKSVPPGVCE